MQAVRDKVVAVLGKQLVAGYLHAWGDDAEASETSDAAAKAAALLKEHFDGKNAPGVRAVVAALSPPTPEEDRFGPQIAPPTRADVDVYLEAMHLHALTNPTLHQSWRGGVLQEAVAAAVEAAQPAEKNCKEIRAPATSKTRRKKLQAAIMETRPTLARHLAHAELFHYAPGGVGATRVEKKVEAIARVDRLLRLAYTLNAPPSDACARVCDGAGEKRKIDPRTGKETYDDDRWFVRPGSGWFGQAPRPGPSIAVLEEALTLTLASLLPRAIVPAAYLRRYITHPMRRTPKSAPKGRHDEWQGILYPHVAAAVHGEASAKEQAAVAAAAMTTVAACAKLVVDRAYELVEDADARKKAEGQDALLPLWILLATIAANALTSPELLRWLYVEQKVVLENLSNLVCMAYEWQDGQGNDVVAEKLMEAMSCDGEDAEALLRCFESIITALGGALVRVDLREVAAKHAAAASKEGKKHISATESATQRAAHELRDVRKTLVPTSEISFEPSPSPAAAAWTKDATACVPNASSGWLSALQDAWGRAYGDSRDVQRADAAASTIKSLCHKWGAPALLDGVVVVGAAPEQGVADFAEEIEHERKLNAAIALQGMWRSSLVRRAKERGTLGARARGGGGGDAGARSPTSAPPLPPEAGGLSAAAATFDPTRVATAATVAAAAPAPARPDPHIELLQNAEISSFLKRALDAAGVAGTFLLSAGANPQDYWNAIYRNAAKLNGRWQARIGWELKDAFHLSPPPSFGPSSYFPVQPGPYVAHEMRAVYARAGAEYVSRATVWQDGADASTAVPLASLDHLFGPNSADWEMREATAFYHFAFRWGEQVADGQALVKDLNTFHDVARNYALHDAVGDDEEEAQAADRVKEIATRQTTMHKCIRTTNSRVQQWNVREQSWRDALERPLGVLHQLTTTFRTWLSAEREKINKSRGVDVDAKKKRDAETAAHVARLQEDLVDADAETRDAWYELRDNNLELVDEDGFGVTAKVARSRERRRNARTFDPSVGVGPDDFTVAGGGGGKRIPAPRPAGKETKIGGSRRHRR